ncbi:hypothetical protein quinque_004878 [Culex quinquefasciatus]
MTTSRNASNLDTSSQNKTGTGSPALEHSSRNASNLEASVQDKTGLGTPVQDTTILDGSTQETSIRNATQNISASQGIRTPDRISRNVSASSVPKSQLSVQVTPAPTGAAAPEVRVTTATPTTSRISLEPAPSDTSQWNLTAYQFNCPLLPQDIAKDYNELGSIQLPEYYQLVDHTLATVFNCFKNGRRDVQKLQPDQILWALKMIEAHQVAERDLASENVRLLKQFLGEIVISMASRRPARRIVHPRTTTRWSPSRHYGTSFKNDPACGRFNAGATSGKNAQRNARRPNILLNATSSVGNLNRHPNTPAGIVHPLHTSTPIKRTPNPKKASILDLREGLRQIHDLFSQYKTSRLERNEGDKLNLLAIERLLIDMGANSGGPS